ncbi:MAG: hypothetical protein KatS3mg015_1514 [Fimbriimonadales bacterium]|nr:MAG: hypothetical protein KatS3mg015_1514 [Fimbriimonadales bacterium]
MKRRPIVFAVVALLTVVGAVIYWLTRPTLADDAIAATRAVVENDPATLYDYTFEFQREQIGMTREDFVRYWQTLIAPRYSRFRPQGEIRAHIFRGGHQAEATLPAVDENGFEHDFGAVVWETGHGGRRSLLGDLVGVWWLEFLPEKGGWSADNVTRIEAILQGLRRDRKTLESLGITRIPGAEPGDRPVTLDEWERRLVRLLEELKRNQPRADPDP